MILYLHFIFYHVFFQHETGMADFRSNGGRTGRSLEAAYSLAGMAAGTEQLDFGSSEAVDGRYSYRVLGNDVKEGTVRALEDGFLMNVDDRDDTRGKEDYDGNEHDERDNEDRCAMAQRLMSAMMEVYKNGLGDMRCINDRDGITSTGAYLHVDEPDGRVLVHINKPGDGTYEPMEKLREEFVEWERRMGCRVVPDYDAPSEKKVEEDGDASLTGSGGEEIVPDAAAASQAGQPRLGASVETNDGESPSRLSVTSILMLAGCLAVPIAVIVAAIRRRAKSPPSRSKEDARALWSGSQSYAECKMTNLALGKDMDAEMEERVPRV